jgi:hypothetical protein
MENQQELTRREREKVLAFRNATTGRPHAADFVAPITNLRAHKILPGGFLGLAYEVAVTCWEKENGVRPADDNAFVENGPITSITDWGNRRE